MRSCSRVFFPLYALVLAAACATTKPDLVRLYSMQEGTVEQPPVILIHGLLGGRLSDVEDKEYWPGSLGKLMFSDYENLALQIDPATLNPKPSWLHPSGITDKAAGQDFYVAITDVLEEAGGYVYSEPGRQAQPGEKRYYIFYYDWRQDNVQTVRELDAFIEQIRRDYDQLDLEVDVIAHSMGGLIVRYYVRYGTVDVLDQNEFPVNNYGATQIRRAVLLGTPNLGSAEAVKTFIQGFHVGFGRMETEVLATWPSSYQLLPHAITDWLVTESGKPLNRDLFDANLWRRFQWSVFDPSVEERITKEFDEADAGKEYVELLQRYFEKHLERGRRFSWSLTVPIYPEPQMTYVVFGGDCNQTPARILVEEVDGVSVVRLFPKEVKNRDQNIDYSALLLEPGDGTVTKASLLARQALDPTVARHKYSFFPLEYAFFLCETHTGLTRNINFQDNLLHVLLTAERSNQE